MMPWAVRWPCLAVLCGLGLAACAGGLAGQPDLLADVKRYYDRYAMEEGGLCASPQLGPVTGSSVQEQSADRLILRVTYVYSDQDAKTAPIGSKGPSRCRGVGTRNFTIAKAAGGFEVLEMTGAQHKGIKIIEIDDSKVW